MHELLQFLSVPANQDFVGKILGGAGACIYVLAFIWLLNRD